jgi:plastocyanin
VRKTLLLLLVPLALSSCSSGSKGTGTTSTTGAPDAQTVTVDMRNDLKYHPSTIEARVGTVTFDIVNAESVPHDLAFKDSALGKTRMIDGKTDVTLKVTFSKPGTYDFVCTVHSGMDGKVVVS